MRDNVKGGSLLMMQGAVIIYSFCGVFQKLAARYSFLSMQFILFYGASIGILFLYAILWQIILKRVPLTTAYSNRAVAMIWSLVWSVLIFHEALTWNKIVGAIVIGFGIYTVMVAGNE